jgi:hypothetical protein
LPHCSGAQFISAKLTACFAYAVFNRTLFKYGHNYRENAFIKWLPTIHMKIGCVIPAILVGCEEAGLRARSKAKRMQCAPVM